MAPGPKKKSFHTPRNPKNVHNNKGDDKKSSEIPDKSCNVRDSVNFPNVESESFGNRKYSKRSLESNWNKYEEPQSDPHADYARGNDFEVLLSYSGGSGSQIKLQEEKDWEDDCLNNKEISLNFQDLINAMKCIPFHERINTQNVFGEKHINNFIFVAQSWEKNYKPNSAHTQLLTETFEEKENTVEMDSLLNIVESPDSTEPDVIQSVKSFVVPEKTVNIINALASNITFKEIPEKEVLESEIKSEDTNDDLDFLLSLNISSTVSVKAESVETSKAPTVDDWLNSILDD